MQEKIDILKERLDNISSILGEGEILVSKIKNKKSNSATTVSYDNITDAVNQLNGSLPDSGHVIVKEALRKSNTIYT